MIFIQISLKFCVRLLKQKVEAEELDVIQPPHGDIERDGRRQWREKQNMRLREGAQMGRWRGERSWTGQVQGRWADEEGVKGDGKGHGGREEA